MSNSLLPSSGAPLSRRRPNIPSCSLIDTRSQNSTSIRISRTTTYDPLAVQDGSAGSSTQTRSVAVAPVGLAVPSLKPSRLRDVPDGRGGEL